MDNNYISLDEVLNKSTVAKLKETAKVYKVKNISKMKKAELIEALKEAILDKENLLKILAAYIEYREYDAVEFHKNKTEMNIAEGKISDDDGINLCKFVYAAMDGESYTVVKEVADMCKELDDNKLKETVSDYHLVFSYIRAFSNLCGVYEINVLTDTFNSQNKEHEKLTKSSFIEYFNIYDLVNSSESINGKYVVSDAVLDENELSDILKSQEGKEYFIPEKEELTGYSFSDNIYGTAAHKKLRAAIRNAADRNCDQVGVFYQICTGFLFGESVEKIIMETESLGVIFRSNSDREMFERIVKDVEKNTRMWENKGFTPNELAPEKEETADNTGSNFKFVQRQNVKIQPIVKERKIGRNDPCPCGSGKKYKKCCGRNL